MKIMVTLEPDFIQGWGNIVTEKDNIIFHKTDKSFSLELELAYVYRFKTNPLLLDKRTGKTRESVQFYSRTSPEDIERQALEQQFNEKVKSILAE